MFSKAEQSKTSTEKLINQTLRLNQTQCMLVATKKTQKYVVKLK